MKKLLLWLFLALLAYQPALGADTKLQDLTATTTPTAGAIVYIVEDPTGTPLDRKVTVGNLAKGMGVIGVVTVTQPATAATLTIINNKTFTVNKTLTLDGTDGTTMTFPSTSATIARTDAANTFTGSQTFSSSIVSGVADGTLWLVNSNHTTTGFGWSSTDGSIAAYKQGTQVALFDSSGFYVASATARVGLGTAAGSYDTYLQRTSAGVAEINNGTLSAFRDLKLRTLISSSAIDLSAIAAGSPNLTVTATSDTPSTAWNVVGTANASNAPSGFFEIIVGGNARYIPFFQ